MSQSINNLRFLELSIPAKDVLSTLQTFQHLGFQTIQTNDIWDYPYVVISDGRCYIGIHQEALYNKLSDNTRFVYVHNDVPSTQRTLFDAGYTLQFTNLDNDNSVQQCLFQSPSGFSTHILAARTFSPLSEQINSALGYFRAYLVPNNDINASTAYWNHLGLLIADDTTGQTHVSTQGMHAISGDIDYLTKPALLFEHSEPESIIPILARYGIGLRLSDIQALPMDGLFAIDINGCLDLIIKKED